MFPLQQILHEMAAEKLRLCLTILAIVWSTMCISTMLATGEGLRQGLIRSTTSGNGDLIYVTGGTASITQGRFFQGKAFDLHLSDRENLATLPDVKRVSTSALWDQPVTKGDRFAYTEVLAVENNYKAINDLTLEPGGRWFNPTDTSEQRKVVIIGKDTAMTLFNDKPYHYGDPKKLDNNPIGQTLKIGNIDFTVIGILDAPRRIEQGSESMYATLVPLATWQRFFPQQPINAFNVEPQPHANRERLAVTIRHVLAKKYNANINDETLVQTDDMLLNQESMRNFLLGLQTFLGIIGFVTLMVAGIGIANVMYASVKRATRDIGIRMAVGATPNNIRCHYLIQAMLTMMIGGTIGLCLTVGLIALIKKIPMTNSELYIYLGKPQPELSLSVMAIVVVALIVVGIVAAWFPANKAASITPLEALQSE